MTTDAIVFLGIGSNINPEENLRLAMRELRLRYGQLEISAVYRNAPMGFSGPDFLNVVVRFESEKTALDICHEIAAIHNLAGRCHSGNKWESRTLDIDMLLYNDLIEDECPVRVPRPDILEYSFVLRPLAELAPDLAHPVTGRTIHEHWQEFDASRHPLEVVGVIL